MSPAKEKRTDKWLRAYPWLSLGNAVWGSVYAMFLLVGLVAAGFLGVLAYGDTQAQTRALGNRMTGLLLGMLFLCLVRTGFSYALYYAYRKPRPAVYTLLFIQSACSALSYPLQLLLCRTFFRALALSPQPLPSILPDFGRWAMALLILLAAVHAYLLGANLIYFSKRKAFFGIEAPPSAGT